MAVTTYTTFVDGTIKYPLPVKKEKAGMEIWSNRVDFSKQNITGTNEDVHQVLQIPANTWVFSAWINVITAATTNAKVHLGYGSDVDRWGICLPIDSTGVVDASKVETSGGIIERAPVGWSPLFFSTADTIDIKATLYNTGAATISSGVIEISALVIEKS